MMTPSPSPSPSQSMAMINIASSAQKLDVNNRISLGYYFRIADNILRQADIFRAEKNIIDLYIMLLRFSSLVTETIPYHRDYRTSLQSDKIYLKKRLLGALTELEDLKSDVQRKIEELKRKQMPQVNKRSFQHDNNFRESSLEWPLVKQNNVNGYTLTKASAPGAYYSNYLGRGSPQLSITRPVEEQFRQISLNVPRPKEETLSRHSILGPNGLYKQWQPPPSGKRVLYPSNIDWSPVEIPSKSSVHPLENGPVVPVDRYNCETTSESADQLKKDSQISETLKSESADQLRRDTQMSQANEPLSLISFEATDVPVQTEIIRQPSPPPVLADIQDLIPTTSNSSAADSVSDNCSASGLVTSEAPLELHIPTSIMDSFMRLAKSNTVKNLETCGVLAGSLKNRKFCITALIIPKQESTSDSCQTTNEEEIFEVQDKQSLFPLGWIHTHPTQSCFMSSIDVHTHYSYQIMLPESIAIVMAPTDSSRNHGIFRLTPGGLTVIRQCPRRGFHPHDPPADGGPIYKQCTDVYINPKLKFDVIDLR